MRKILLLLTVLLLPFAASPAFACSCTPDSNGTQAGRLLSDQNIFLADVTVRGFNMHNRQSALQIDSVRHGGLVARNIRAKFGATSCAIVPNQKKMTALIRAENDGSYSIADLCDYNAVVNALKGR